MVKVEFLYNENVYKEAKNIYIDDFRRYLFALDFTVIDISETMKEVVNFASAYAKFFRNCKEERKIYVRIYGKERIFTLCTESYIIVQYYGGDKVGGGCGGFTRSPYEIPIMIKHRTQFLEDLMK